MIMFGRSMRYPSICIALICICLSVFSCTPTDRFVAGESLNREDLEAIRESIFAESSTGDSLPDGIVYWTESGRVYHSTPHCSALRDADSIKKGTQKNAEIMGKDRLCAICRDRDGS